MSKKAAVVHSHWFHLIGGLPESPQMFYKYFEDAINQRGIPDVTTSRVEYLEGGIFSAKREYLRVERDRLIFDICAAPVGNGFFVSWWMGEVRSFWAMVATVVMLLVTNFIFLFTINKAGIFFGIILGFIVLIAVLWFLAYLIRERVVEIQLYPSEIPLFGKLYDYIFKPVTYYRIDTTMMFQESVHAAVLEVVDAVIEQKGLRKLSDADRKPIMKTLSSK